MPEANAEKIGWIGAGKIGLPMLLRLAGAGYSTVAFDTDPARRKLFEEAGVSAAASARAVAQASKVVVLNLPSSEAVLEILFGDEGCISTLAGKLVIDTSSIDPVVTADIARRLAKDIGCRFVDAPVSGGTEAATQGKLVAFVGGEAEAVAQAMPLIGCFASQVTQFGDCGTGQWAKAFNQAIVCGTIALWSEAMTIAKAGGLDGQKLVQALANAGADSRVRAAFGTQIAGGEFVPSANLDKDIHTALKIANAQDGTPMLQSAAASITAMRKKRSD